VPQREHPFPFFYAYALLAVWYGDGWDGLGAVILSAVACADVLPPDGSLSIAAPVDIVAEAVLTASSLLLVALVQRLRRAHTVAQAEIVERRRVEDALRASEGRLLAEHAAAEAARQGAEGAQRVQDDFLATVARAADPADRCRGRPGAAGHERVRAAAPIRASGARQRAPQRGTPAPADLRPPHAQ